MALDGVKQYSRMVAAYDHLLVWLPYHPDYIPQLVTHTGGLPGASSTVSLFPDQRVAIVQLANADEKHLVEYQIRLEIEQAIFGYSSTQESDDIFRCVLI
jgi:hypothetical protein